MLALKVDFFTIPDYYVGLADASPTDISSPNLAVGAWAPVQAKGNRPYHATVDRARPRGAGDTPRRRLLLPLLLLLPLFV